MLLIRMRMLQGLGHHGDEIKCHLTTFWIICFGQLTNGLMDTGF